MRIGLALFFLGFLSFSCHYVSSPLFNDSSSLQAVSGCTAAGGGGPFQGFLFFFVLFLMSLSVRGQSGGGQMPQIPTTYNNGGEPIYYLPEAVSGGRWDDTRPCHVARPYSFSPCLVFLSHWKKSGMIYWNKALGGTLD